MLTMMMFDSDEKESRSLKEQCSDAVAHASDDQLIVSCFDKIEKARKELNKGELMDAAFLDLLPTGGIELSKEVRQKNELAQLLIIADSTISPMLYMTPDIRAASLLLRPFSKEMSKQVIDQFFAAIYREKNVKDEERKMILENREGRIAIPYSKIYYLEVRGKKVYIRLKEKEYSKYETLENVMKQLPENFIRCHRSFVVNRSFITKVKLSENTIFLEDDIMVPLARSYKADVKDMMKQRKESGV